MDRVAEGQVLLQVLRFSLAHITAPTLHTHLLVDGKGAKPECPSKSNAVSETEEHWREKCFHRPSYLSKG